MLEPIGYNKGNLSEYYQAGKRLNRYVADEMFKRFSQSDNKTITILTGTPGSGKSFATESRKEELKARGIVVDSPLHTINDLQNVINMARNAGAKDEDIQVIAVYNDFETTFRNSIIRGKDTDRWLTLGYFIDSFQKNQGKIEALFHNNPDVEIVTIDNSHNQNKEVGIEDAVKWDYTVSNEQKLGLKRLIENDTEINEETKQNILADYESVQGRPGMASASQQRVGGEPQTKRPGTGREIPGTGLPAVANDDDSLYSLVPDNNQQQSPVNTDETKPSVNEELIAIMKAEG